MVLVRAIWVTSILFFATIIMKQWIDPAVSIEISASALRSAMTEKLTWLGAIFAGVYVSLYARFASQWRYLADLYNKIKETQVRYPATAKQTAMAEWKAGFFEDAQLLHLATHRVFVSVIRSWGAEKDVRKMFLQHCPRGQRRFDVLMRDIEHAFKRQETKYGYKDGR